MADNHADVHQHAQQVIEYGLLVVVGPEGVARSRRLPRCIRYRDWRPVAWLDEAIHVGKEECKKHLSGRVGPREYDRR